MNNASTSYCIIVNKKKSNMKANTSEKCGIHLTPYITALYYSPRVI